MTTLSLNRQCSRCPRVDQKEITAEEIVAKAKAGQALEDTTPMLVISVRGKEVVNFPHLCKPCVEIVAAHIESVGTKLSKVSSTRSRDPAAEEPTPAQAPEEPKKATGAAKGAPARPGAA